MGTESARWFDWRGWQKISACCHAFLPFRRVNVAATILEAARDLDVTEPLIIHANAVATDVNGSIPNTSANGLFTLWIQRLSQAKTWALAVAALVLGWTYAPNFRDLFSVWSTDPNYSHGYLIIPIALFLLWRRLSDMPVEPLPTTVPAPWWGWVILSAVLALRALAYELNRQWLETATLLPVIACLTWTLGSWPLLRRAWPAILYLVFLFPLPPNVNDLISLPLQGIAATGSCFLLQLSGLWAVQVGNVIHVTTPHGVMPLDVALACNGLRMLMTMAATITAAIIYFPLPTWKRITLLASTVPVAMLSNIIRIVATGWCYYEVTGPQAKQWAHDASGLLMMPLALFLVWLELRLLSWLVPEDTEVADIEGQRLVLPALYEKASGKNKQQNADLDELPKTKSKTKSKTDDQKVILPALYEKPSGKKKQQNTDLDELV
jgi:exosortase